MPVPKRRPYEAEGRSSQKRRTRDALVATARELVARGITPTVDEVAAAASISRTTAYRYFPTRVSLLEAAHPWSAHTSLLPKDAPTDVGERLRLVVRAYLKILFDNEDQQRTVLRLSLDPKQDSSDLPLRQGRVIGWLEDALAPAREQLGAAACRRLALAIRSATGIEALVWLVDVGGQSRTEAAKLMRWSADALLAAALAQRARRHG